MHPIWPYENDSLCDIDSDPKEREGGGSKIRDVISSWGGQNGRVYHYKS